MGRVPTEIRITERVRIPGSEIELSTARSGGPGGQHVNKTETKVLLRWSLRDTTVLSEQDHARLTERLASRLTNDGDLTLASDRHRDQRRNVEDALERFAEVLRAALARPKKRRKTKPTRASQRRRLDEKRRRSETKRQRRTNDD